MTVGLNPTLDRVLEVPGFAAGQTLQGQLRWLSPGGKAFNVSLALAALGVSNTAAGLMGLDTQELFERTAAGAGVSARFTTISSATRQNITILDPLSGGETHLRDVGPPVTEEDIGRLMTDLEALVGRDGIVVFSGSLPPGLTPPRFGQIVDACIATGATVAVDSSGAALRQAAARPLWLIKPNEMELRELFAEDKTISQLFGGAAASEDAVLSAGRRLNARIPIVLITLGERGAYCLGQEGAWHAGVTVPPEQVRSVTGCGDALLAGFLAAQMRGERLESALRYAVAVAAASARTDRPAVFMSDDVTRLLASVRLREIAS